MSLEFDVEKAKRIVPLTIVYVLMVASTNLCLHYVQVSFFQVSSLSRCRHCLTLMMYTRALSDSAIAHAPLLHLLHRHLLAHQHVPQGATLLFAHTTLCVTCELVGDV
jgi:hypothetical protein